MFQIKSKLFLYINVTHMATKEDTKEMDEAFKRIDVNHDGKLSLDELVEGIKLVYPEIQRSEVEKIFKEIDIDGSGNIDYTEWISATINKKKLLSDKNLKAAFDTFDEDKGGSISVDEIKKILGHEDIKESVWDDLMKEVDEDKDGMITFEEFKKMMLKFVD